MHFSWLKYVLVGCSSFFFFGKHRVNRIIGHLAQHISFHLHCANHLPLARENSNDMTSGSCENRRPVKPFGGFWSR